MLRKENRLTGRLVDEIFKTGRFVGGNNLTLKFILKSHPDTPRIGFIVPKTTAKLAVTRNLLRRQGYQAVVKYLPAFPLGFVGAFVFGKKSPETFAHSNQRKSTTQNPGNILDNEIKSLLIKIN